MFARCGPRELRHIPYTGARTYGYMYIYIYTHMYIVHYVYYTCTLYIVYIYKQGRVEYDRWGSLTLPQSWFLSCEIVKSFQSPMMLCIVIVSINHYAIKKNVAIMDTEQTQTLSLLRQSSMLQTCECNDNTL